MLSLCKDGVGLGWQTCACMCAALTVSVLCEDGGSGVYLQGGAEGGAP